MEFDREKYVLEVFMTDDGCTDGTAEAVLEEFPDTVKINNSRIHLPVTKSAKNSNTSSPMSNRERKKSCRINPIKPFKLIKFPSNRSAAGTTHTKVTS